MVSPNFHPYIGGAEKQALEVSKALAARGVDVRVLTRRADGLAPQDTVAGIPVTRAIAWGGGFINALVFMCSSFLHLAHSAARVFHVHLAGSPALSACLAAYIMRRRVVVKVGGGRAIGEIAVSSRKLSGRLKLALLRLFSPNFVAVTRDLADEMREHGFSGEIKVIPNGVDTEVYHPASADEKSAIRKRLGWKAGLTFLYVGRLAPEKQLDRFLKSFAQAADASARCIFVGAGPEEGKIRAAVAELKLTDRVQLFPSTQEIADIYRAADVFILPSVSEGLSNALLEAMASGLAPLGSRVGGTLETISEGETGLLFGADDDAQMQAQIKRLCSERELAPRLGAAARLEAERRFALPQVAQRYLEVYGA
jgi:glycosyltransferase involved in cell wall biosynthesis